MKPTKVLARLVSHAYAAQNLNPDLAFTLLSGAGVFRGAHNMVAKDFESYRVDRVNGHADETVTYETLGKEGKSLPRELAALLVSAADANYKPMAGEHVICAGWDGEAEKDFYLSLIHI